jgi:hypothetical protein
LIKLYKTAVTARYIKENCKCLGHVTEMDQANAAKSTVELTPECICKWGTSKFGWPKQVENCPRQLKLKQWRQKPVIRGEWPFVAKGIVYDH